MIWGSGGSKSRLAKAAGAEPAGQMRDEKLHAVVARSTFRSQNVQKTPFSDHFVWKLRCRKSARRCGAKHISKSKCTKHTMVGPLLEVEMSKKCTPLLREAHFEVKMFLQNTTCSRHFWRFRCRFAWQASAQRGFVHLVNGEQKREGFAAFPETMASVGHLKRIFKDAFRVEVAVQKTLTLRCSEVRALISWEGLPFWSVRSSGSLRWFCVTGAALRMTWHQFFVAGAVLYTGGVEKSNPPKRIGTRPSALHSTFHFWRKSRRIALFLMLSSSKIEEVSQNCFVLDVVKFKKKKKSRRIVSFLTLLSSKIEEVS